MATDDQELYSEIIMDVTTEKEGVNRYKGVNISM